MSKSISHDGTLRLPSNDIKVNALTWKLIQLRADDLISVGDLVQAQRERDGWSPTLANRKSLRNLELMHKTSGSSAAIMEFSVAHVHRRQGHLDGSIVKKASAKDHMNSAKARRYHLTSLDSY